MLITTGGSVPCGKSSQVRHRQVGNLRYVRIGVGARLKINLDQAHAGHRPRFHVIDAAASVKNRSNVSVMSASICCGGMPL